jgi:triacylglycerol lipase
MNTEQFSFTPLVEPASSVSQNLPAGFDAAKAYLLGQCCSLTYQQFDQGEIKVTDFASLIYQGYTVSASNLQAFTVSEAEGPGVTTGDAGDYFEAQGGFGVQLTLTPTGNGNSEEFVVIAIRGTRTWTEWFNNADAIPVPFAGAVSLLKSGLGSVHGGFYGDYTIGTDGVTAAAGNELSPNINERASGSLAAQVGSYASQLGGSLPVYVTGHSLGGALAALCALDLAYNFSAHFADLSMYSLASPRVAVSLAAGGVSLPLLGNQQLFLAYFQSWVPNAFQIVNAADMIPTLPPVTTALGPLTLTAAHVSDAYQLSGSGATATPTIDLEKVINVNVSSNGSGYSSESTLPCQISGGGGANAVAQALTGFLGGVNSVSVLNGGGGYTSAPAVTIPSQGSRIGNVVTFCAQTGDIGQNHACVNTYVPYLAQLAAGLS